MHLVDLDVTLVDMPYAVSRKLTVPLALQLPDLHLVLQAVMGWDNSHLYDFSCGRSLQWFDSDGPSFGGGFGSGQRSLKRSTLTDILAAMGGKKSFTYTYDMGDSWEHDLRPSRPRPMAADEAPFRLRAAVGSCPPDDSGGAPGFGHMLDCLEDPHSDERADYVEWLGAETWDQTADVAELTERLGKVAKKRARHYADNPV